MRHGLGLPPVWRLLFSAAKVTCFVALALVRAFFLSTGELDNDC
jgi:hypothetical protein